jgi:hypothetical protein
VQYRPYFALPLKRKGETLGQDDRLALGQLDFATIKVLTGEAPRAWTPEEMTKIFMDQAVAMARYWETVELDSRGQDVPETRERLEGLLFSLFSLLDGSAIGIPGFQLVPSPSPEDQEYDERLGNNWWPLTEVPSSAQLKWPLHEILSGYRQEKKD